MADKVVEITEVRIASCTSVSDGLKFYTKALLKSYGKWVAFPKTGKRDAQVIKAKAG
jgi:hypothetical protein